MLIEAIDRAGSTEPAKIQAALKATDLKPDQLIMGYKGVKFDDKGQNMLASGLVIQLQDGENYVPVWPKAAAKTAPHDAVQGLVMIGRGGTSVPPFIDFDPVTIPSSTGKTLTYVLYPRSGDRRRTAARRRLCVVLVRPHA